MLHCLSGVAAAGANLAPHVTSLDGAAIVSGAFFSTRTNTVNQNFDKRFLAIDCKLKRQKLHREDIRDLIELTNARMEIYHLVGTLLLAFCMGWYTDSSVWQVPGWFSNLFLISNFGAVGYLIMCVWLAMYASIASRSIGTRLLTRYTRLSVPTNAEIDEIKNPIFGKKGEVMPSTSSPDFAAQNLSVAADAEQGMVPEEDDFQHFHRFMDELPRWVVYDHWARVCMSFGMNQMLQALSYFSMGTIWSRSPLAAIMSFTSIHFLALLILSLDLGELSHDWIDILAITLGSFMPAALAVLLLMHEVWIGDVGQGFLVIVVFCAHGGWLWYLTSLIQKTGKAGRFQPGNFVNILEWVPADEFSRNDINVFSEESQASLPSVNDTPDEDAPEMEENTSPRNKFSAHPNPAFPIDGSPSMQKRGPKTSEINGGHTPGVWMSSTKKPSPSASADLHSMDWLPVKMVKYFTHFTVGWWCLAGVIHSVFITFDQQNKWKQFTGDDVMQPLVSALLQLPAPANLFKISSLQCSNSRVWVSSGFSIYAMAEQSPSTTLDDLTFIRDGNVGALICGALGCDALSPPDGQGSWMMEPLEPFGSNTTAVPIPNSWRLVSGSWIDCPTSADAHVACTSAWIVGWDGAKVFAATLERDSSTAPWSFNIQFEADPAIGLCVDGHASCRQEEPQTYDSVKALQLSSGGGTLTVLLGFGIVDVWDLSLGVVLKRIHLGDSYTSMCHSDKHLFLSRESSRGPVVKTMPLTASLTELLHPRLLKIAHLDHTLEAPVRILAKLRGAHASTRKGTHRHHSFDVVSSH